MFNVIEALHQARLARAPQGTRSYLGCSQIGAAASCARKLWYEFRFCHPKKPWDARLLRLFETGHIEESRLINELRIAGIEVLATDPKTQKQWRFSDHGGHFSGSCDGIIPNHPDYPDSMVLLEIKTHNDKSFKDLKERGVKNSKWMHYVQIQCYLGLSQHQELKLAKGFYLAVNKNTDELYGEMLDYDKPVFIQYHKLARQIILAKEPLTRISNDPNYFECKLCDFARVCHPTPLPPVIPAPNCRNCISSTPVIGGWKCERHEEMLPLAKQWRACPDHLFIPPLLQRTPLDYGPNHIAYDGFVNTTASEQSGFYGKAFTSFELALEGVELALNNPQVEALKNQFGVTLTQITVETPPATIVP